MVSTYLDPATVHRAALVIDTHADTAQRFLDEGWSFGEGLELGASVGHMNLETARHGGLDAEFFAIWVDPTQYGAEEYVSRTRRLISAVRDQVTRDPARLALCTSPAEIVQARDAGKFAVLLGVEGGHSIANSLDLLREYYDAGVRYMTLTWANSNEWAESSGELREPGGLTEFGRSVVREMNRLGMMVDVSHVSDRTLDAVLAVSQAPVLASHSSARALCDSPRNLTDDQLRAIAANGGAVMVNFYSAFVDEEYRRSLTGLKPDRRQAQRRAAQGREPPKPIPFHETNRVDREFGAMIPRPAFASLMAHFEHMIEVAGVDHVGIGTDFDGISSLPQGIDSAADLPKITEWLLGRGYSVEDVRKVLGGNLMRVFGDVEAAAEKR